MYLVYNIGHIYLFFNVLNKLNLLINVSGGVHFSPLIVFEIGYFR
jgi:hypothetical protein